MNKDWERKAHVPLHVVVATKNEVNKNFRLDPEQRPVTIAERILFSFSPEQGWALNVIAGMTGELGTRHGLKSLEDLVAEIPIRGGVRTLDLTDVAGGHLHLPGDVEVHFRLGNRSIGAEDLLGTTPGQRRLLLFLGAFIATLIVYGVLRAIIQ